jgi:hypothetical protein
MGNFSIKRAVSMAAFGVGLWAYKRPATRRAYIAAADAIGRRMRSLLGEDYKLYYYEGSVRRDILHAISEMPDLKCAVLERTSIHDRDLFAETGYIKPEISRIIGAGPDLNLKTSILSRMSLKECYQVFYEWNKKLGAKRAIVYRVNYAYELMNAFGVDCGPYQGKYKGFFYALAIDYVRQTVSAVGCLPICQKATEQDLKDVRTVIEMFDLNSIFGDKSFEEWYDEFYRNPLKYCAGNHLNPMMAIANDHMNKAEGYIDEAANKIGILTRMIPKVVIEHMPRFSEEEAKEKIFEPLNEYLRFLAWLPAPEKVTSEEMALAFCWALSSNRGWLFGRKETSDLGISMSEYAQAGMEKIHGAGFQAI